MTDTKNDIPPIELRGPLMDAMMAHIPFDGWSEKALFAAAADLGYSAEMAELAYPRGAIEVLEEHLRQADEKLFTAIRAFDLDTMRIRDKVTEAVKARFLMQKDNKEAVRRGLALLSQPPHAPIGAKALWNTCDTIWRAIGDTSTDFNYYTKRMTLSGVYSSTLMVWLSDDTEDHAETWAFLDRRIENVMQFEKMKFQAKQACAEMPSLTRFIERLRRPA